MSSLVFRLLTVAEVKILGEIFTALLPNILCTFSVLFIPKILFYSNTIGFQDRDPVIQIFHPDVDITDSVVHSCDSVVYFSYL